MTEQELYDTLYDRLCDSLDAHYAAASKGDYTVPIYQPEAYAELAKDIGEGPDKLMAGTTVRILMVSRLGDMGITNRLDEQYGYLWRVQPGGEYLDNCRLTREPM